MVFTKLFKLFHEKAKRDWKRKGHTYRMLAKKKRVLTNGQYKLYTRHVHELRTHHFMLNSWYSSQCYIQNSNSIPETYAYEQNDHMFEWDGNVECSLTDLKKVQNVVYPDTNLISFSFNIVIFAIQDVLCTYIVFEVFRLFFHKVSLNHAGAFAHLIAAQTINSMSVQ